MKKFLNNFKNSKIGILLILSLLLFLYTIVCAIYYVEAVSTDISDSVFRLHVIANSDSVEDQELKLKVRDSLLKYMNSLCSDCTTKEEAISIAMENKGNFQRIAEKTITENGIYNAVTIWKRRGYRAVDGTGPGNQLELPGTGNRGQVNLQKKVRRNIE